MVNVSQAGETRSATRAQLRADPLHFQRVMLLMLARFAALVFAAAVLIIVWRMWLSGSVVACAAVLGGPPCDTSEPLGPVVQQIVWPVIVAMAVLVVLTAIVPRWRRTWVILSVAAASILVSVVAYQLVTTVR